MPTARNFFLSIPCFDDDGLVVLTMTAVFFSFFLSPLNPVKILAPSVNSVDCFFPGLFYNFHRRSFLIYNNIWYMSSLYSNFLNFFFPIVRVLQIRICAWFLSFVCTSNRARDRSRLSWAPRVVVGSRRHRERPLHAERGSFWEARVYFRPPRTRYRTDRNATKPRRHVRVTAGKRSPVTTVIFRCLRIPR